MKERKAELEKEIERLFKSVEAVDKEEDNEYEKGQEDLESVRSDQDRPANIPPSRES